MLFRRRTVLAAAVLGLMPLSAFSQETTELDKMLASKSIRAGAVEANPWFAKDFVSGEWTGLVPDILDAILADEGIDVEYVDTQWGTAVAGLQSGRFDLMGGYNETPERAEAIDFTMPIGGLRMSVLTLKGAEADFASWDQLNTPDVKLAVVDGSGAARTMMPIVPDATWVALPSSDMVFLELESGRADAIVSSDAQIADYIESRGRGTLIVPTPVEAKPTNIGLRKSEDGALDAWLDERIEALIAEGTMDAIWAKYTTPTTE